LIHQEFAIVQILVDKLNAEKSV